MGASLSYNVSSLSPTQVQVTVFGESGSSSRYRMELVNNATSLTYVNLNLLDGGVYNPPSASYTLNLADFTGDSGAFTYTTGDPLTMIAYAIDSGNQQSSVSFTGYYFGPLMAIIYYGSQSDALAASYNYIDGSTNYTLQTKGGYSNWMLASNSSGSSSQLSSYAAGSLLISNGTYYVYPANPCFLKGSTILCFINGEEKYAPIESITKGTLVKTVKSGYKTVQLIGRRNVANPSSADRLESRLYVCSKETYPELKEDLILTGSHSLLVRALTPKQRIDTIDAIGSTFVTDGHYRLMAYLDERAEPWLQEGNHEVWHLALENDDIYMNYGVFANGGLLVETTSLRFLKELSNMELM
uniref:Hedgehog/Intein (Hint) domain-containing protein n=1 Tax=viral metagenome TaxID=1070528 RepID=A0A6C0KV50_9ZZZZ